MELFLILLKQIAIMALLAAVGVYQIGRAHV